MSTLISLEKIYLSYGTEPLLDHANFQLLTGERVCLIGRNGAGKSSFLKMIDGTVIPDSGKIHRESGIRIARLEQELPQERNLTVYEAVSHGLAETGQLLTDYHQLLHDFTGTEEELAQLEKLQSGLDACNGWQFEQYIQEVLTRLDLPADEKIMNLSGGWQRRVALAKALVIKPDLLLLDEPTNHLDVEAIQWLEEQLLAFTGGILFITHDRTLLRRLATRIIELDRGNLTSWPGDYDNFLRRKEEMLSAEANLNKEFDKKLAEEERWIRQGIKARRTRNEGRVRALEAMRQDRQNRREIQGKVSVESNDAAKSGKLVVSAEHVSQIYGEKTVIKDFSIRIMRGDRIGLLGPNGAGKTTLLNLLLGTIPPQKGNITQGTKLEIAYFDQLRATLNLEQSIMDNLAGGRTSITVNGKDRHVISYLSDFLFPPQRIHTPVKALSGGECNRLLLAKLFSLPANVLVMDEPTNDLDIETLELLEELLSQFSGTLLLVSHDRTFLDNIVTSTLVFEGNGQVTEYVGGYQDWLRQRPKSVTQEKNVPAPRSIASEKSKASQAEQKEFINLPSKIEQLEKKQADYFAQMGEPDFYQQSNDKVTKVTDALKKVEKEIEQAYARWDILEKIVS